MISIIVPVYNAAAYIGRTMEMVAAQTYTDWELLLVDDASTDDSAEVIITSVKKILAAHPAFAKEKIRLIRQRTNQGAAAARNRGLEEAGGRYIAFLDADDIWMPDKLARTFSFMEETGAGFVFTAYAFGDAEGNPTRKVVHVPDKLTYKRALSRTVIFTSTVLLDTKIVSKDLIHMPEVPSEDTATWWQILRSGAVARGLDQVLVIYRRPPKSLSSNKKEAVRRIWNLYRKVEGLGVLSSFIYLTGWAVRALKRRL